MGKLAGTSPAQSFVLTTMYANNYNGRLYLPDDIDTSHSQDQQSFGASSQFTGQALCLNMVPTHVGLGPPPSTRTGRTAISFAPPTPTPTHGLGTMRAASSPQLPYGDGQAPGRTIAPDIAMLLTQMTIQQDHLEQENQLLKQDNNAFHARLASVESRPAPVGDPAPSVTTVSDDREAAAKHKKQVARRARKERGLPPTPSIPDDDGLPSGPGALHQTFSDTPFYLGNTTLPPELIPVRTATQKYVSKIFRDRYLTPNFDGLITDSSNQYLINVVARKAERDLNDVNLRPQLLATSNATFDLAMIYQMAQKSFTNLRPKWRRQNNPELAARAELANRINRWKQRRSQKVQQKLTVVRAFAAVHKLDANVLTKLLDETYESDEASGPEDDSGESKEAWKARMASVAGIRVKSSAALAQLEFLEVLDVDWRSDEFSKLGHAMHKMWFNTLTKREKNAIVYIRVRGTGRSSSRIPELALWNFGISVPWLETARTLPENEVLLLDWNTHGNPAGADENFLAVLAQIDDHTDSDDRGDNNDA
ncbi:hypothetical protein K438DRAFT_2024904 [Mycena galopus ATCC 62051]|nr:hypothetical protein K438DRAFT_2024904 [Mycena galopus ATCC 62051]